MILTDIKKETKALQRESGKTWDEIGRLCGISRQGAFGVVANTANVIPRALVEYVEALGYDIEIEFVRR